MMKKLLFICLFLILIVPTVSANDFNPQSIGYMEAEIKISSKITSDQLIDEINQSIYAVPENYYYFDVLGPDKYQIVEDENNKKLNLQWNNFKQGEYEIIAKIRNNAKFSEVEKTNYPYDAPENLWVYLGETDEIVITDEIREKSNQIASGSESSFEAVSRLSTWVYSNLEYDLSYSNVSMPSDHVFKYKKGTCDEFTTLFIAMSRSIGIPTKYISGITYTEGRWGYHAWAEVYLNKWVPVDPTWNEFGWIDATHIKLGEFMDAEEVKIKTNYVSSGDPDVNAYTSDVDVKLLDYSPIENIVSMENEVYPNEIGINDLAVLEILLKTKTDGCLTVPLKLVSRIDDSGSSIISFTPEEKSFVLCPGETEKYHFLITPGKNLDKNYIYYDLADIYTPFSEKTTIDFKINPKKTDDSSIVLSLNGQTVEPGDEIEYEVSSDSSYKIYSDLKTESNKIIANKKGNHYIIAVNEDGKLIKKTIEVKEELKFKVTNIVIPPKVICGESFNSSINIENYNENNFKIQVDSSKDIQKISDITIEMPPGDKKEIILSSKTFENCTGEEQYISIKINDQRIYQKIKVESPPTLIDTIIEKIKKFFEYLSSKIESI